MGNFSSSARRSTSNGSNNSSDGQRESGQAAAGGEEGREEGTPLPSSVYPGRYNLRRTAQRMRRRRAADGTSVTPPIPPSALLPPPLQVRSESVPLLEHIYQLGDARPTRAEEEELESGRRSRPRLEESRPRFEEISEAQAESMGIGGEVNRFRRALEFIRQMRRHSTMPSPQLPQQQQQQEGEASIVDPDMGLTNIVVTVRILDPNAPLPATSTDAATNATPLSTASGTRSVRFEYTVYFLAYNQNEPHPQLSPQQIAMIESRIQNMVAAYSELAALTGNNVNTYEGLSALQEMLGIVPRGASLESIEQQVGRQLFRETGLAAGFACSICLGEVQGEEATRKLPCGHVFHVDCIDPWLLQCNNCPLCRSQPVQSTTNSSSSSSSNANSGD